MESTTVAAEPVPLIVDPNGVIKVQGTRVTLDTIVSAYKQGATAEQIVMQYPTVTLAAIYQVIGYYLRHIADLQPYFEARRKKAEEVRRLNEERFNPVEFRERLLTRR